MIELFLMLVAGMNGQGVEGDAGCSGNPNPPNDIDVWKYNHGEFTSRRDDIRIGSCYSSMNMALMNGTTSEITITLENGTVIDTTVYANGSVMVRK